MKQMKLNMLGFLIMLLPFSISSAVAQNGPGGDCVPKFGPDSIKAMDEISLYVEYYKQENYKDALPHWRYVFKNAPGSYEAVHIAGIKMYQNLIEKAQDPVKKEAYIDTLMMIYDKRIQCFGSEGYNLGRKGYDLMKYRPDSLEQIRLTFDRAIKAGKDKTEYFIIFPYAKLSGYAYQKQKLTMEDMMSIFNNIMQISEENVEGDYSQQYQDARQQVIQHFTEIGILSCENLVPIFTKKYKENPDDIEGLKQGLTLLQNCDACKGELGQMWKKLYSAEPSPELALKISECEADKGNMAESTRYLEKALETATDPAQKAKLAYNAATRYYNQKNFSKAREYAYKAANFRSGWGEPYLLIGNMYAASGPLCGSGTGFESQVVVWAAIDMWEKAKSIDGSVASEANKQIGKYSQYMPTREQLFERGIEPGSTYKVECWIQESTTVRAAPR